MNLSFTEFSERMIRPIIKAIEEELGIREFWKFPPPNKVAELIGLPEGTLLSFTLWNYHTSRCLMAYYSEELKPGVVELIYDTNESTITYVQLGVVVSKFKEWEHSYQLQVLTPEEKENPDAKADPCTTHRQIRNPNIFARAKDLISPTEDFIRSSNR